jgi:molecular chaperone DnaK
MAELLDIPPAPRGVAKVEVTLEADVDGLVHLSAQELRTETQVKATITVTKALDPFEIAYLAEEALQKAQDDLEARHRVQTAIVAAARAALAEQEATP